MFSGPSTKSPFCPGSFLSKASHTCSTSPANLLTQSTSSFSRSSPRCRCIANSRNKGLPVVGPAGPHICPACHPKGPSICSLSPLTGPLKAFSQGLALNKAAKFEGCSSYSCKSIASKDVVAAKLTQELDASFLVFLLKALHVVLVSDPISFCWFVLVSDL